MPDTDPNSDFLELYFDETDEQLDALAVVLTAWDEDRSNEAQAREVLRLIHAMEGAAGAVGLEHVLAATQFFDREFVRARNAALPVTPLLQYAEFLRSCNGRLRGGETLGSQQDLLQQMKAARRD